MEALLAAMSDILWNIGEKMQVTVAVPGESPHIVHSHTYFQDSVTEKVRIVGSASLNRLSINPYSRSFFYFKYQTWRICKYS